MPVQGKLLASYMVPMGNRAATNPLGKLYLTFYLLTYLQTKEGLKMYSITDIV